MPFTKGREKTGGRSKGAKNKATIQAESFQEYFEDEILADKEKLVKAIKKAIESGNSKIIVEILNRLLGKITEKVEVKGDKLPFIIKVVLDNDKSKREDG